MSAELIATLAVGVAVAGIVLNGQRAARQDIKELRQEVKQDIGGLRQEVKQDIAGLDKRLDHLDGRLRTVEHGLAKIEGLLEGLRGAILGTAVSERTVSCRE